MTMLTGHAATPLGVCGVTAPPSVMPRMTEQVRANGAGR
jgi:hypothetical protein